MGDPEKNAVSTNKVTGPWYGSQDSYSTENKTNGTSFTNQFQSKDPIVDLQMQEKPPKVEDDDGHGTVDHPTSYAETLTHLLKGNIGSGMFAMGDAFQNAGIVVAPIAVIILGVICVHCQHLLLSVAKAMKIRTGMELTPGFAQTVELCFSTGHPRLKKIAPTMKTLVNLFLCVTQLGFCCVYFVFVSNNLKQIMDNYKVHLDLRIHMAIIFLPILLTCLVRNLKHLAPLSTFANVLMLTGFIITLYFITQDLPPVSDRPYVASWEKMPLFFGTALFAFEGIGLVLPIQREMKEPKHFAKPMGVLNVGMTIVTCLFVTLGFLAYLQYGENIQGSVTLNLGSDVLAQAVKAIISLGILFTFALQFYIPVVIMWPMVQARFGPFKHPIYMELGFRCALVVVTFALAEGIPYLNHFISLIGAISSTALALIIPPILDFAVKWSVSEVNAWTVVKNILILIIGVIGCITGTYASIVEIVNAIKHGDETS